MSLDRRHVGPDYERVARGPDSWLLKAIKRHGNVADAAAHFGVSSATVYSWANGKHKPDDSNVASLAEWVGVSEPELRRRLGMPTLGDTTTVTVEVARLEGREGVLQEITAWLETQTSGVRAELKHLRQTS